MRTIVLHKIDSLLIVVSVKELSNISYCLLNACAARSSTDAVDYCGCAVD